MAPLVGRNIILEFKGSYFLSTNCTFKQIYRRGGALFGPELTVQLRDDSRWYAFASIDYFQKTGRPLSLCNVTKIRMLPLGLGLKYFAPIFGDCADVYLGLGFQPVYVHTKSCVPWTRQKQSKWGFGGIAKVGAYVYLPHNFLIDFFIDYSFVKVHCNNMYRPISVLQSKANISGAIFGVGLGYRF